MNDKLAARRIGRAIFEIDNALWHLGQPQKRELEQIRMDLGKMMNAIGYEFAKNDSPLVRKRANPISLRTELTMHANCDGQICNGENALVPSGTQVAEVIANVGRGVRGARRLIRVVWDGKDLYGWIDARFLTQ